MPPLVLRLAILHLASFVRSKQRAFSRLVLFAGSFTCDAFPLRGFTTVFVLVGLVLASRTFLREFLEFEFFGSLFMPKTRLNISRAVHTNHRHLETSPIQKLEEGLSVHT
jgi:hypothetical protein